MIDYTDGPEQATLRVAVRSAMERMAPRPEARHLEGDPRGYDQGLWRRFDEQFGCSSALLPADEGGGGMAVADLCVALEEAGRACFNGPLLTSGVLAGLVLSAADGDRRPRAEPGAVMAVTGLHHGPEPLTWPHEISAVSSAGRWRLSGTAHGVIHGWGADGVLVIADADQGRGVWYVDVGSAAPSVTALTTLDLTRSQADYTFDATPASLVVDPGPVSEDLLDDLSRRSSLALSAEQAGAMDALVDMCVTYAGQRFQFGRAIGSFQAVKHRIVDMAIAAEGSRAGYERARALDSAAESSRPDRAAATAAVAAAAAYCSESFVSVAQSAVQLHGGLGMSWEHDAHLYLRRAKASERLFGTPSQHRSRLAASLF
jgi:alkylation response protein AidB-like acyl-CoA dehydrogenase